MIDETDVNELTCERMIGKRLNANEMEGDTSAGGIVGSSPSSFSSVLLLLLIHSFFVFGFNIWT